MTEELCLVCNTWHLPPECPSPPAAPTPSAEELDALEALLRPGSQGTCAMCDQVCDTAADAIKALRHQVLALQQEVTLQTALKNQAMRLKEENPCGG